MSMLSAIVGYESGCRKNKIRQNSTLRHNFLHHSVEKEIVLEIGVTQSVVLLGAHLQHHPAAP